MENMADKNLIEKLRKMFEEIRDERKTHANTATRIGNAFLSLLQFADDISGHLDDDFLSKKKNDRTPFDLNVGGKLTAEKDLEVGQDAMVKGRLSNEEFISGFLAGKGWSIFPSVNVNVAGEQETKWNMELDNLTVRGALRVFEMVISQLLGENDNRVFTAMMEVDHYDPSTGRVYLDTQDGKFYNPFRRDDCIMVQQYNGMPSEENNHYVTKHYELVITNAGCGDTADGEDRLDWVEFARFQSSDGASPQDIIQKGDTFVRVDNLSDEERKGIVGITTVGSKTPYIDIIQGLKTDPDNSLKGRLGNLAGIRHHLFGWLQGFGELLQNLYAVGDFRLRRTGESLDAKVEMTQQMFATRYQRLHYDLSEQDNYLHNATWTDDMDGWTLDVAAKFVTVGGLPVVMNGNTWSTAPSFARLEELDGQRVLRIVNCGVWQENSHIRKPGTHKEYEQPVGDEPTNEAREVGDTLYLSLRYKARTPGQLTVGFDGSTAVLGTLPDATSVVNVTASDEWQVLEWSGTWDGLGDFRLAYTGDMVVSLLSLTDRRLDEYRQETMTAIEQTASNIRLIGKNIDNVRGTVTQLGIDLDAMDKEIRLYVNEQVKNAEDGIRSTISEIEVKVGEIRAYVDDQNEALGERLTSEINIQAGRIDLINTWQSETSSKISGITTDIDSIRSTVGNAATKAELDAARSALQDNINTNWWLLSSDIKDARDHADSVGDGIRSEYGATITTVQQNANSWTTAAGRFDSTGHLTETGYLFTSPEFNAVMSQRFDPETGELVNKSGLMTTGDSVVIASMFQGVAAELETSVKYDPVTGKVTSKIKMSADQIDLTGYTTINNYFHINTDGSMEATGGKIAGFKIQGNGLTNDGFNNDAYIIFRNDEENVFAGMGGNVLPSTSGARALARFENHDTQDMWGLGANYGMIVSAQGSQTANIAIAMEGGCISGLGYRVQVVSSSCTINRSTAVVACINTAEITITLPTMEVYDDGHVVKVKNVNGAKVVIKPGYSYHGLNHTYRQSYIHADKGTHYTNTNPDDLEANGDATEYVYVRDIDNGTQYGCWIQFKHPREW